MAADDRSLHEVVTDLEVRLAFQDNAMRALDDVVRTLFARVGMLEKELKELRQSTSDVEVITNAEPPPHY
jgi:uncharacterized coiled-coil protein SlyX